MDRPGDQFLARAGLAMDQNRSLAGPDPADQASNALHGRTISY